MTQNAEKKTEERAVQSIAPPVRATNGILRWDDMDGLQRLSRYLVASKMLPKNFDTPEKAGIGIQYAVQLGFRDNWLLAIRQIAVVNGNPAMFGDLPLAMVRASGELEMIKEFLLDKDGKVISAANSNLNAELFAAVCVVKRKGFDADEKVFTVEDAKKAGIWGQNVWKPYPKRMIQMRVRSHALKDNFGDILNGAAIGEYDYNTTIEKVVDVESVAENAPATTTDRLNALKSIEPEVLPPEVTQDQQEPTKTEEPAEQGAFAEFSEPQTLGGEK